MKINLTHEDFITMAKQYVANMGIPVEGKEIDISASIGRKEKRITASVSILDATPNASIPEPLKAPVEAVKSSQENTEPPSENLNKVEEEDRKVSLFS